MRNNRFLSPALGAAALLAAAGALAGVPEDGTVTFNEHIAPIVYNNCTECHRPNGGAPMDFLTYEDVFRRAKLIAHVTETKYMPPWKAVRGYNHFENERHLEDEQIALIRRWVDAGAPEGDAANKPAPPAFNDGGWHLGEPDLVLQMQEPFTVPADGPDIYVNFVVPIPDIPKGKWLKAYEFRPKAKGASHHCLFSIDSSGTARRMDEEDPRPGYYTMLEGFGQGRSIGGWAVGQYPLPYPDGVAIPVRKNSDLVLAYHFHPSGKEEVEQAEVAFYLTDEKPTRRMQGIPIPAAFGIGAGIDIPAGDPAWELKQEFTIPVDVDLVSIWPHAHYICKELKGWVVTPDGEEVPLVWIKDWDFAWQEQYRFKEPVRVPAGSVFHAYFQYDNAADNPRNPHSPPKRITWGPESTHEMAYLGLNAVPVNQKDGRALWEAVERYEDTQWSNINPVQLWTSVQGIMQKSLDRDDDGVVSDAERRNGYDRLRSMFFDEF